MNRRITIRISNEMYRMILALMNEIGTKDVSETVRLCLFTVWALMNEDRARMVFSELLNRQTKLKSKED